MIDNTEYSVQDRQPNKSKWFYILKGKFLLNYKVYQIHVFILTFLGYAITHASRKALSGTKPELLQVWTNYDTDNIYDMQSLYTSEEEVQNFFGYLDMSFCLAYALGMYFFGFIGNKYNPVNIIAIGSICSGIYTIFFGYIAYTIKIDWPGYFIILWLLNGFFQASIFPNMVAIVSNWFDKDKAGIVFGIWSANAAIGNILGELLAYLAKLIGFSYLYLICGILMISIGIQYKFGLVLSPLSVFEGLHSQYTFKLMDENETLNNYSFAPDNETEILNESSMSNRLNTIENTVIINSNRRKKNCGILSIFIDVILKPQVLPYTITYSLSKMVHYSFFFWLPLYLTKYVDNKYDANSIAIAYDVATIFSSIIGGIVINCTKTRSPLLTILCIISIPFLLGFVFNPSNVAVLIFMIIVMGLVVGGPNVLISSAVSVHISSDKNKIKDVSAVTGFLDGIGSTCVGIIQAIIPLIIEKYDWSGVFIVFLTLQILSLITLLYIVKMDKVWKIFVKDKHLSI